MAFKPHLSGFLRSILVARMPRLDFFPFDGRIPKGDKLAKIVRNLLSIGATPSNAVIALTDVYTGTNDFANASDAKAKMRRWVGPEPRFHPHAAQYDFEAWLLPYWTDIQRIAGHNRNAPSGLPESVNHNRPPSYHIQEIFRIGTCRDDYSQARDANRILLGKNLGIAASKCPEFKSFLNAIIGLCGGTSI